MLTLNDESAVLPSTLLKATGATVTVPVSGCASQTDTSREPDVEPVRQLGDAPAVARSAEPTQDYEYLPEENRVRVRSASGETSTFPFPEWGTMRAANHGAAHISSVLDDESLLVAGVSVGWGRVDLSDIDWTETPTPTEDEFDRDADVAPRVSHEQHYDRNGNLLHEPAVSFDAVASTTPRKIETTVLFPEREYTATLPVVCERTWFQNS